MATYKDLIGTAVRNNAGNLSEGQKDQIFYDSTNIDFKYQFAAVTSAGTWSTGNDLNTARRALGAAAGSGTQALAISGDEDPPVTAIVEQWNGGSWTEVSDLSKAKRSNGMAGTNTAGLLFGGVTAPPTTTLAETESWNGTSWTNIGALPTNIYGNAGFGTSALAIACGGLPPGTDTNANMRAAMFYNGTSWSDVAEMATSRASANGAGTNTSATNGLAFGGYNPLNAPGFDDDANKTEEWTVDLGNKTITTS